MPPNILTFANFEDVLQGKAYTIDEIRSYFKGLYSFHLVQAVAKINISLWKEHDSASFQIDLVRLLFQEPQQKEVLKNLQALSKQGRTSFLFHRHQLLLALKIALQETNNDQSRTVQLNDLGPYLLSLNSYLENRESKPLLPLKTLNFESARRSIASLYYFSHQGRFVNNFSRAISMWIEIPESARGKQLLDKIELDIQGDFKAVTGTPIETFLGVNFFNLAKFYSLDIHTEKPEDFVIFNNFLSETSLTDELKKSLQEPISLPTANYKDSFNADKIATLDEEQNFVFNFMPFLKYPLIKLSGSVSIIADPAYLEQRLVDFPYFVLLEKYKVEGDKKKQNLLAEYYGLLHQEYAFSCLKELCDEVVEVPTGKEMRPDFIGIIRSDTKLYLFVFEAKKISLALDMLLTSDKNSTLKFLKEIVRDDGKLHKQNFFKGFTQVFRAVEDIQNGLFSDYGLESKINNVLEITHIFPIVVTDRFVVEETLNRKFYEDNVLSLATYGRTFLDKPPITHPMFISVEELELIEERKQQDPAFNLFSVLGNRHNLMNDRYDIEEDIQFIENMQLQGVYGLVRELVPMWDYILTMRPGPFENKRLKAKFDSFMARIKELLFPSNS